MKEGIKDYKIENNLNLEKIINEYSGYVYKVIKNMSFSLSNEDVEEIVSDTFFVLWKNREKLEDERKLSSYIAGITRNLVREKQRKQENNKNILDYEDVLKDDLKIDMLYEQREKISIIENIVKSMKEEDITIFKLYYYSSKKIKEIAKELKITEFNVKTKLYRIRKKVKKELIKEGYSYDRK